MEVGSGRRWGSLVEPLGRCLGAATTLLGAVHGASVVVAIGFAPCE